MDNHLIPFDMTAQRLVCSDMVNWLSNDYGYDKMDAYQLLGQSAVIKIANVVDPRYSGACAIDSKPSSGRWRKRREDSTANGVTALMVTVFAFLA